MNKIKKLFWYLIFFLPALLAWYLIPAVVKYWKIHGEIFDEAESVDEGIKEIRNK